MGKGKNYSEVVTQAEQAVQSVKDPELRRVAFEKILDDLLGGGSVSASGAQKTLVKKAKRRSTGSRQAKAGGPQGHVEELIAESFFSKPKTIAQVKAELENRGHHIALTSLS